MTQTIIRRGSDARDDDDGFKPNGGRVPRLSGDIRHLVPKLGLREYWYPLCGAGRIKKNKPLRVRMLGEDLCVFRGKAKGEIYALSDICPHRGARLSEGDCHYEGTVACPYHGWVFDGSGKNVAVLSEGPNSLVCGKPGTEARSYSTQTVKNIVFVWMGEGEPADIKEDVPEEFFRDGVSIFFNERIHWRTNWEVGLENSMDSHVTYLHRDNLQALLNGDGVAAAGGAKGYRPVFIGNGFMDPTAGAARRPGSRQERQSVYPQGWKWPKSLRRRRWNWLFAPFSCLLRIQAPAMTDPQQWVAGHHLPGIFRASGVSVSGARRGFHPTDIFRHRGGAGLFGLYTRQTVPVDEWLTRVWYHHSVVTNNRLQWLWACFVYFTWGRWTSEYNFSQQDMSVMLNQVYDAPEKLSGTDAEVVQWRRLIVTKHFGGRNHPFDARNAEAIAAIAEADAVLGGAAKS